MISPPLAGRLAAVRDRIAAARERAGRTEEVAIVAVTKTHPAERVRAAAEVGLSDVGENRVGELEEKVELVGRDAVRWHMIGHLQRNKVRVALPLFDLLHSLDSERLARALSREAEKQERQVRALIQVNTAGEESKGGFAEDAALDAIGRICEMPRLRIEGIMTMAPLVEDRAVLRRTFAGTRRIHEEAARQIPGYQPRHLSMGMSNDFEIAVEEGSTLVRLGTVLFGEREE